MGDKSKWARPLYDKIAFLAISVGETYYVVGSKMTRFYNSTQLRHVKMFVCLCHFYDVIKIKPSIYLRIGLIKNTKNLTEEFN